MSDLRKLPIGMQTFEELITKDYLYVDKTRFIHRLITRGKAYFLARPRRFGKSLLLSTLRSIFEGRRDLFKGLAIGQLEYDWQKYPVIHLSMPALSSTDHAASFRKKIAFILSLIAHELEVVIAPDIDPESMLKGLIIKLEEKHGKKVVVLVDEYDKPILDVIHDDKKVDEMRSVLSSVYTVLKSFDSKIQFLFLTGVSQFSKTSIFSGLNQLQNISLSEGMAGLCGYTDEELDHYFPDHIVAMQKKMGERVNVRDKLRIWYDGYKFHEHGPALYNPFSILNALEQQSLANYWFSTGTPTFLISLLKKYHFGIHQVDAMDIDSLELSELTLENPSWATLLYQTGYVTINTYEEPSQLYRLRLPNKEVRHSLFNRLLVGYIGNESYTLIRPLTPRIYWALVADDWSLAMEQVKTIFAKIPYDVTIPRESYYQTIFYTIFLLSGLDIVVEETTNNGRIDAVITTPTHRYIIEMKLDRPLEETFQQIQHKQYAKKYSDDSRCIQAVGIVFDSSKRTVVAWGIKDGAKG